MGPRSIDLNENLITLSEWAAAHGKTKQSAYIHAVVNRRVPTVYLGGRWLVRIDEKWPSDLRKTYTDHEKQTIVRAVRDGMGLREASRKFGVPATTIRRWLLAGD